MLDVAVVVLAIASLFFYAYWNPPFVLLIIFSIAFNYSWGRILEKLNSSNIKKPSFVFLFSGVAVNIGLIIYFKYCNFFLENIEKISGYDWTTINVFLPLGISFFTFQQIAYLVDCFNGKAKEHKFIHYVLFVTFFPQLIAGPIVRYDEIMPQFKKLRTYGLSYKNLLIGVSLFSIGLFKKVAIADTLSPWVATVFDATTVPTLIEAWGGAISYTFQIYFDFSGYTDMAIGLAKLFNIDLPINFNSPYKAVSIVDFWRRWHITLSLFFRDYLYIPLGGNKKGKIRQHFNIMITMCLCGLWHGASWTFVFWGALHGVFTCINHIWRDISRKKNIPKLPSWLGWFITFFCVVFCWVFFRANTFERALLICRGMIGLNGFIIPPNYLPSLLLQKLATKCLATIVYPKDWLFAGTIELLLLPLLLTFCLIFKNSITLTYAEIKNNPYFCVANTFLLIVSVCSLSKISEFLYFQF
ncbi:MAG: MBOAT family protein [Paludibacter sp.]|nr:MBOAT family protein [Paludibacter sp.]